MSTRARKEALDHIRWAIAGLEAMAERIGDSAYGGEPLEDDADLAAHVVEAMKRPGSRRLMDLVDAIGLCASSGLALESVRNVGGGWGFNPDALHAAVKAWRAPLPKGRGSGRTSSLWRLVHAAVRSAGAEPPSPESLRKAHERWRRARGRRAR
jgi:hypothetical protein